MSGEEVSRLNTWLQLHPRAWHGWPTFQAVEGKHAKERLDRLQREGCPFIGRRGLLREVDEQVRQIRAQRYREYCRQVERSW